MEDGVLDWSDTADLVVKGLLSALFVIVPLAYDEILIDIATLLRNGLPLRDLHTDDVLLVEVLGPAFRDSILDFVFDHDFIRTLGECLRE